MNPVRPGILIWLLVLALCWAFYGMGGRDAWHMDEVLTLTPMLAWLDGSLSIWALPAPLYHLTAGLLAKLGPFGMDVQDSARMASGLFIVIALAAVGLTARRLFGVGYGPAAVLALMGSFGLMLRAHAFLPESALLAVWALLLWGMSEARTSPRLAGGLIGVSLALLTLGLRGLPDLLAALVLLFAPLFVRVWRDKNYKRALLMGLSLGAALIGAGLLFIYQAGILAAWLQTHGPARLLPTVKISLLFSELAWFAWPLWPLAMAAIWHEHRRLTRSPSLQLPLIALAVLLLAATLPTWSRAGGLLPVLLPMALLAAFALEYLRRGAAQAFYWFGVLCFLFFAVAFWIYFAATEWGVPAQLSLHIIKLNPAYEAGQVATSSIWLAAGATVLWLLATALFPRAKTRPILVWATGMVLVWVLLISLFRPWAEAGWGYKPMLMQMATHLPDKTCLEIETDEATATMVRYHLGGRLLKSPESGCHWRLVQNLKNEKFAASTAQVVWEGMRPRAKRHQYRLEYSEKVH